MPSYLLLAGHGTVLEAFDTAADARAIDCARGLTYDLPPLAARRSPLAARRSPKG